MANQLTVFNEQEVLGKQFRMYGDAENPLFLAKDVAEWIGHTDLSRMVDLVDDEEKLKCKLYVSGQNREMWFLTEDGLYEVLMQSRKAIAKKFKKKVKQILKSIRKHGIYATTETIESMLSNSEIAIKVLEKLKAEQAARQLAEKELARATAIYEPMLDTFKHIISNGEHKSVNDVAHLAFDKEGGIDIGGKRLYQKLRNWGFVKKNSTEPTQLALERNILMVKIEYVKNTRRNERVTKVTPKGEIYIIDRLIKERKRELRNKIM
ncbi:BRO family protein [Bacillus toyonensis]|uniref:BRO family protein n=1 Tax=Bacillus toyonensis TaxID=155322 RepID=UPI000BEC646E|nr:BRO family protein [Bacillus toyonensis]PED63154.1 phage antirepressor Ant [Bacillus toyonensis]PEN38121.1 phage antirepressor Ant [Bacillus toyonensis]